MDWGKFIRTYSKLLLPSLFGLPLIFFGSYDSWNMYFRGWLHSATGWYITVDGWIFVVVGLVITLVLPIIQIYFPKPASESVIFDICDSIKIENNQIMIPLTIIASPPMLFQSLELVIQGKHIKANDWQPIKKNRLDRFFYFNKPPSIKKGEYQERLIAYVGGLPRRSDKFNILVKV
jgi:hypothetical protein